MLPRVAAEEGASKSVGTAVAGAGAGVGVGVLAFVDAGVDSAVPAVPPAVAAPATPRADVDIVEVEPKTEPVVVVDGVACDDVRDGEPNEKPMLPALGGGGDDFSLPPGETPNPN